MAQYKSTIRRRTAKMQTRSATRPLGAATVYFACVVLLALGFFDPAARDGIVVLVFVAASLVLGLVGAPADRLTHARGPRGRTSLERLRPSAQRALRSPRPSWQ